MENSWVTKTRSAWKTYSPGDLLSLADLHDGLAELAKLFCGQDLGRTIDGCCNEIANQLSEGSYELDSGSLEEIRKVLERIESEPERQGEGNVSCEVSAPENSKYSEYFEVFSLEMRDRISRAQELVLEIEKSANEEACQELFRIFHTVKGEAGFLKLPWVQELFHALESLLNALRKNELGATAEIVSVLFEGVDATETFLNQGSVETPALVERKTRIVEGIETLLHGGQKSSVESRTDLLQQHLTERPRNEPIDNAGSTKTDDSLIKISGNKLSRLYELVSEMLILQDQLKDEGKVARQLRKVSREVQQSTMNLNTITLKPLFVKMKRAVRDLAKQKEKLVDVEVEGESLEIDRTLVEALEEPLIHLVRNCVGHGIETAEVRKARNKPVSGSVKFCGELRGNRIILTVRDDGGGLEKEKIVSAALKNEIVSPERAAEITDKEIYELIFRDGLSTAERLDDVAGRGVGMSIVKKTVEKFRGNLEIETELGKFTAFHLIFPLSSALIDGVMVEVSDGKYILPVESVLETIVVPPTLVQERDNGMRVFQSRGSILPVFDLKKVFFGSNQETCNDVFIGVVVETTMSQRCVFLVQRVLDKKEFVIKPLGARFKSLQGVSAAAILRDGEIGFLVDIDGVTTRS